MLIVCSQVSVGIENISDIIADFEQSFEKSATKPSSDGKPGNAEVTGDKDKEVTLGGST